MAQSAKRVALDGVSTRRPLWEGGMREVGTGAAATSLERRGAERRVPGTSTQPLSLGVDSAYDRRSHAPVWASEPTSSVW